MLRFELGNDRHHGESPNGPLKSLEPCASSRVGPFGRQGVVDHFSLIYVRTNAHLPSSSGLHAVVATHLNDELPMRRVALAFMAHPDDAEFLCAGSLIRLAELGWELHISTATAGDCGSTRHSAEQIAEIRRHEALAAANKIGAAYHCLEERDVNVVFDKLSNGKAIDLLRGIAPSLVFTHPLHDYMLDHEQVHQLARSATFSYPIPNASALPRIDGSAVPWLYYCDPIEGVDPYTREPVHTTLHIDISDVIDRKIELLACHASQREWLRSHHGMDEYMESMKRHSAQRGSQIGVRYAEAFAQHTGHPYPRSDILKMLLGGK